jgi:hypothetical protein
MTSLIFMISRVHMQIKTTCRLIANLIPISLLCQDLRVVPVVPQVLAVGISIIVVRVVPVVQVYPAVLPALIVQAVPAEVL